VPDRRLVAFDENIISTSPAGSCLLKVLADVSAELPVHLFCNRHELKGGRRLRVTQIPLPAGPVLLRALLFTILASLSYFLTRREEYEFRIGTQGVFPFCHLSYAHFCHRLFLRDHRASIGGSILPKTARILNHLWGALTERIAFSQARTIVVPSEGLARELNMVYPRQVEGKIRIIPNPVDLQFYKRPDSFEPAALRGQWGCNPHALVLCFCALGNFERKGLRLILEALTAISASDVRLVVAGGSVREIREYNRLAAGCGVRDRVFFAGMQHDIRPYLWSSDLFIFPSAYEVFPLVCLQAAASGLPLIATKMHGVEEFMAEDVTGWTVPRNAGDVTSAILRAFNDRSRLAVMGEAARRRVEMYGEDEFHRRWRLLLAQVLKTADD